MSRAALSLDLGRPLDLAVPITPLDHTLGGKRAQVTVVEYGDFACPLCRQAASAVKLLLDHFEDRIRFVYRHFPQETFHPHALRAAEAAECAACQGYFWHMHDLLFAHQDHLQRRYLPHYAAALQLDIPRFTAELDDEIHRQRIREQMEGGRRSHLRATPGFYVNGMIVDVAFGMQSLLYAVATELDQSPSSRALGSSLESM